MRLGLAEVLEATGGRAAGAGPAVFTSFHTDSRDVRPGGLFFALKGGTGDGHDHLEAAAARGAAGAVVERSAGVPPGLPEVQVTSTWRALFDLAAAVREVVRPVVVGVTGSNGKTSTRELTAGALATRLQVLTSERNLNTETGVPLTLLRLEPGDQVAVLEMGMQGPGEIGRLARLARPEIGVVTGIGTVHAEYFTDGRDGIARTKAELLEALPAAGTAVVNADDDYFGYLSGRSAAPVIGYGFEAGEIRAIGYRPLPGGGSAFSVDGRELTIALSGRHMARNALAALAVARRLGVPDAEAAAGLARVTVEHRLQPRPAPGGYVVVDDAYNASPESMTAAFETMAQLPRDGRLLAVLGEMRELGPLGPAAHRRAGEQARATFDGVAVVDSELGRVMAEAAGADVVGGPAAAVEWVRGRARPGDLVLVKASHGVALEEVVEALCRP